MTLGEKIRKYRNLNNMTQHELGQQVGFSSATADSRIRKYESDLMAPKEDIRKRISTALNVDLPALSDVDIETYEDIMYIFFEFEEKLGMNIEKKDGHTYLSFNDDNKDIRTLITYMNFWINQRNTFLASPDTTTEKQKKDYELWKARFSSNIHEIYNSKTKEINELYRPIMKTIKKDYSYAEKTSEITLLLRKIIESGFSLEASFSGGMNDCAGPDFTFKVYELLQPPSENAKNLFTQFLLEIEHFSELGANVNTEYQKVGTSLTITYHIPVASFSVISSQIKDLQLHMTRADNDNDLFDDNFETQFSDSLEMYYNIIKEEIKRYCSR